MKARVLLITACFVLAASLVTAAEPVKFADARLKSMVEKTLGSTDPTADDMKNLTKLYAGTQEITNLDGIQHATNLTSLCVHNNKIKDISPIAGLTKLQYLCIHDNKVADISPAAGLTELTNILLYGNNIDDISPVANLTSLTSLYAAKNGIKDISAVANLKSLRFLDLSDNKIKNISAVAALAELADLRLLNNKIADLSPTEKLTNLKSLSVYGNPAGVPQSFLADDSKVSVYIDSTQYAKSSGAADKDLGQITFAKGLSNFMVGRGKCNIRVAGDGGTGKLPKGKYKLNQWEMEKKDKDGVAWKLTGSIKAADKGAFEVSSDKVAKLDAGEPVVATLKATKNRTGYSFNQELAGRMGESVTITRDGVRPNPPKLRIKNKAGTYDKTFNFEYG